MVDGETGPVSDKRTDEMQTFDATRRDRPRGRAGLVVLYVVMFVVRYVAR